MQHIGLDKIVLGGLAVHAMDLDYLLARARDSQQISAQPPNANGVYNISIADNYAFADLRVGTSIHNNMLAPYAYITITPTHVLGNNWSNVSKQQYEDYLDSIIDYIYSQYRIVLSYDKAYLRMAEINYNIPLSAPYADYTRPCKVLTLRKLRRIHKHNWHHIIMQDIRNRSEHDDVPYILNLQQVIEALAQLPDKHRNRHRAIAALDGITIDDDQYRRNDRKKALEILGHGEILRYINQGEATIPRSLLYTPIRQVKPQ